MPPKKINKNINNITVNEVKDPVVKSFKVDKPVKAKPSKTVKISKNENDSNEDESDDVEESEEESIPEKVVNSEEEDEDNLDDDIEEVEYKETKDEMEEIDDTDEEDAAEDIVENVKEDDDKSVNDDSMNGPMDITDCLLDDEDEVDEVGEPTMVEPSKRISRRRLTKFERVRLLAARTKQLALGAPPKVKNVDGKSPIEIAEIELSFNMIPFKIKRPLPNNTYEIWKLSELEK
jgi:DNA-directed RNA polymerase subunit K/omega